MKSVCNLVLAVLIFHSVVQIDDCVAQSRKGIKVGVNFASFTSDDIDSDLLSTRSGFMAGIYVGWTLLGLVTLQPELLYTQKGGEVEIGGVKADTKVDYIEIPLLVQLDLPLPLTPLIYAGPALDIKISEGDDINAKSTDFAAIVGVGFGLGPIMLEGRGTFGLTSIDDSGANLDTKNTVISIIAGLGF